jgi:hypothetical protein
VAVRRNDPRDLPRGSSSPFSYAVRVGQDAEWNADAKIIAGYLNESYGIESSSERDQSFLEPTSSI